MTNPTLDFDFNSASLALTPNATSPIYISFPLDPALELQLSFAAQLFNFSSQEFVELAVTNLISQSLSATISIEKDGGMPDLAHLDEILAKLASEREKWRVQRRSHNSAARQQWRSFVLRNSNLMPLSGEILEFFQFNRVLTSLLDAITAKKAENNLDFLKGQDAVYDLLEACELFFMELLAKIPIGGDSLNSKCQLDIPSLNFVDFVVEKLTSPAFSGSSSSEPG